MNACHWLRKGRGRCFVRVNPVSSSYDHTITSYLVLSVVLCSKDTFQDKKWVIRRWKSKKNRQHNCQKKKDKGTNNKIQNSTEKTIYQARRLLGFVLLILVLRFTATGYLFGIFKLFYDIHRHNITELLQKFALSSYHSNI